LVSAQNRRRLYRTNIPNVSQPKDRGILLKDILQENVDEKYLLNDSQIKTLNREFGSKGKIYEDVDVKANTITASMGT
jgi:DNA (cytosine-5)-methyltransferase 3A